jgi:hypothetical protein
MFDALFVDDYQDVTFAAERLVADLRAPHLIVAGDLEQHVFAFQGTTDEPLRRFTDREPPADTLTLGTPHRPHDVATEAWRAAHVSEEHTAVAREIRRTHVVDGVPWRDIAVVVRREGSHAAGIRRALDDARIPRASTETGPAGSAAAARPFVLALRWLVASPEHRDGLADPLLTSEVGRLSPAASRTLLRMVRAHGRRAADALDAVDLAPPDDVDALLALRATLERAGTATASVLDAFRVLWTELPYARDLVAAAETGRRAAADLEAVLGLSRAIAEHAASADASVEAFLSWLDAAEQGPGPARGGADEEDAVHVLTAHAVAGREFDTVVVVDVLEGDFPSITRAEPMFDLSALDRPLARSEVNRARLADERRLFTMVRHRARRRVVLTATDPHADLSSVTLTSRFVDELGLPWAPIRHDGAGEPVSVGEAAAAWRRTLGDADAGRAARLASLDGLLAIGEDPRRWWFQRGWSGADLAAQRELHLSYSRLSTLENCELQFVLSSELGLDPGGGYQAWVGRLIHGLIEDCDNGKVERTPEAFARAIEERWEPQRFPSYAVSEAERKNAINVLVPNWFSRYANPPATATEQTFSFPFDGARLRGKIDRIGPGLGGSRITDYKTGRSDSAPRAGESLQLGIYYLAVTQDETLAAHRPVEAVELAFLGGRRGKPELDVREWTVSADEEQDYQARMRTRVSELIARVRELDETRRYVASTQASCFFCRFQTLCPRYAQGGEVFPVDGAQAPAPVAPS